MSVNPTPDTGEARRFRIMAMYDLLPYSTSRPPNADEPRHLCNAIELRIQRFVTSHHLPGWVPSGKRNVDDIVYSG